MDGEGRKAKVNGMYLNNGSTKEDKDHSSQNCRLYVLWYCAHQGIETKCWCKFQTTPSGYLVEISETLDFIYSRLRYMGLPRKVLNISHCAAFTLINTSKSIVLELYRTSKRANVQLCE